MWSVEQEIFVVVVIDVHAALSVVVVELGMLWFVGGNTLVGVLLVDVEFMKHPK